MDVRTLIIDLFVLKLSAAGVHSQATLEKVKKLLADGVEINDGMLTRFIEDCTDDNR